MSRRAIVFLILFVFFLSIYAATAFYIVNPKPTQPFIGFGVFSEQGSLSGYLPGSNPVIAVNQTTNWHLEITNNMGSVQFIQVVFRIGNNATASPSVTSPASTLPEAGNSTRFIPNKKTSMINFTWTVLSTFQSGGLEFLRMEINGAQVTSTVGAASGRDFRLFFELWTFDEASGSFQYGWRDQGSRIGSWLQVWFTVAT